MAFDHGTLVPQATSSSTHFAEAASGSYLDDSPPPECKALRYFLYTYAIPDNWAITCRAGVFGAKRDGTGLATKVKQLRRGDLIIIRDGCQKSLKLFGACCVCGDVFDQDDYSPFRDLLWRDEVACGRVIYPIRVPVDRYSVPNLTLSNVTWAALDALGFYNSDGYVLRGRQAWAKKFTGNLLEASAELEAFAALLRPAAA